MAYPLMPKATAVWLVENTALTFEQIGEFCGMHALEVQAIADGEVAAGMQGRDPVAAGELTQAEIERCSRRPGRPAAAGRPSGSVTGSAAEGRPLHAGGEAAGSPGRHRLAAEELSGADAMRQVCKLIGTTKPTIDKVRDRTHWRSTDIKARNPVSLGLVQRGGSAEGGRPRPCPRRYRARCLTALPSSRRRVYSRPRFLVCRNSPSSARPSSR